MRTSSCGLSMSKSPDRATNPARLPKIPHHTMAHREAARSALERHVRETSRTVYARPRQLCARETPGSGDLLLRPRHRVQNESLGHLLLLPPSAARLSPHSAIAIDVETSRILKRIQPVAPVLAAASRAPTANTTAFGVARCPSLEPRSRKRSRGVDGFSK